jgi:hypothetical protein
MISARYAPDYQLSHEDCLRYLGDNLHFELGTAERAGAELFLKWANELGLISIQRLQFFDSLKTFGSLLPE